MYKSIMVPVDLEHKDVLGKALEVAADLAKHYGAKITAVSVTSSAPTSVAHNPAEFSEKLKAFAVEQSALYGAPFMAKSMISHDPAVDLDETLEKAASELNADLVVMASHVPGFMDHVFSSRAGYLASHATISVMVVR